MRRSQMWNDYGVPITVIVVVVILIVGVVRLINQMEVPGALMHVEQVRAGVSSVECTNAEDVYGQAVDANAFIAKRQRYNQIWWAAWFVPNAYDGVELIEIPPCRGDAR